VERPEGTAEYATPLGPIWLHGEAPGQADDRPIVLAITGAFAPRDGFDQLAQRLPGAAVLIGHLPGNHCPPLAVNSVGAFAKAYDAAIGQIGRPTVVCGSSIGGLVALALRAPNVRGLVVLEPPLRTAGLWPLIPRLQALLHEGPAPHVVDFIWNVFGVSLSTVEDRSYLSLLDGLQAPTGCVLGGIPLQPPRSLAKDPSYVDEPERAALRAHPAIHTHVVPEVGHNVQGEAGRPVLSAIRTLLKPLAGGLAAG
jgi:pimeloyl-ACP methyl ester carboxylesterase